MKCKQGVFIILYNIKNLKCRACDIHSFVYLFIRLSYAFLGNNQLLTDFLCI